jgi:hypothetical protein
MYSSVFFRGYDWAQLFAAARKENLMNIFENKSLEAEWISACVTA